MKYTVIYTYGEEVRTTVHASHYDNLIEGLREEFSEWLDLTIVYVYDKNDNLLFTL